MQHAYPSAFAADRVRVMRSSRPNKIDLPRSRVRVSKGGFPPVINPRGDFSFLPREKERGAGETRGPAVDGAPAARTISPRLLGDPR